jgi:dTMP kinase
MGKRLKRGVLVAFEGIDGAGKTTQANRLVASVQAAGLPALYGKEPTDGPWGQKIRRSAEGERMPMDEELEAFIEDRRAHVDDVIKPGLEAGIVVVLDRYYFSNAAYQGARGADPLTILRRNEAFAPEPDLLVFLDVPVDVGLNRVHARGHGVTSFERADLLKTSAEIFRSFKRPSLMQMDGTRPMNDIANEVFEVVRQRALVDAFEDGLP